MREIAEREDEGSELLLLSFLPPKIYHHLLRGSCYRRCMKERRTKQNLMERGRERTRSDHSYTECSSFRYGNRYVINRESIRMNWYAVRCLNGEFYGLKREAYQIVKEMKRKKLTPDCVTWRILDKLHGKVRKHNHFEDPNLSALYDRASFGS
ncbi:hypothetical protein PIB30_092544 [Stylosanthes scabra]|uniref:Pentatricopeptide repeat-containing protein n=1 Tax=Stylosanthes scabra TaxID=79078 RepID=A0ABU6VUQ4_9FABA|nr:hypothetical protein [Stylosanthes scabra]